MNPRQIIHSPGEPDWTPGRFLDSLAVAGRIGIRWLVPMLASFLCPAGPGAAAGAGTALEVGLAVRDVTPEGPIWLAGYAARQRSSERVDTPLLAQACAWHSGGERVVFLALDNCEVSESFMSTVLRDLSAQHQLKPGAIMVVSSHTHSGPVLEGPLLAMYPLGPADKEELRRYGDQLKTKLAEVVGAALADVQPARLEHGVGRATFAMNRRAFREDGVVIGENPIGPVDWEVPVLKIEGTNGSIRGILFGYACHATSIAGDDFYAVSGDYIAYARQHLETLFPGATTLFLTGMGADMNPSPRGRLLDSKRHGLELAGAVAGVLGRPMRPIAGRLRLAYEELDLPLEPPPTREQLEKDGQSDNVYIRNRAAACLALLKEGKPLPTTVRLPTAAAGVGDDLLFLAMGGEVVVDYALRFKTQFRGRHPWTIGYAYDVPCYIPSIRVLREGGYEADSSLIYYGIYGPFKPAVENLIVSKMSALVATLDSPPYISAHQ